MSDYKLGQATEPTTLRDKIMNPNIPKSEAEHWAGRRIAELERINAESWVDADKYDNQQTRIAELEALRTEAIELWYEEQGRRQAAEAKVAELEARLSKDAEWNPPWSAAPDRAVGWKIGYSGNPYWVLKNGRFLDAPKFGYSGAWEDSWRMRP